MANVCFSKTEVVVSQPSIEMSTKFGLLIDFDLLKAAKTSDINKCETGNSIKRPRPPS